MGQPGAESSGTEVPPPGAPAGAVDPVAQHQPPPPPHAPTEKSSNLGKLPGIKTKGSVASVGAAGAHDSSAMDSAVRQKKLQQQQAQQHALAQHNALIAQQQHHGHHAPQDSFPTIGTIGAGAGSSTLPSILGAKAGLSKTGGPPPGNKLPVLSSKPLRVGGAGATLGSVNGVAMQVCYTPCPWHLDTASSVMRACVGVGV